MTSMSGTARLLGVSAIFLLTALACKQPQSVSSVKTLDNFASKDGQINHNVCEGDYNVSKSGFLVVDKSDPELARTMYRTLTSIPTNFQDFFFKNDLGSIIATSESIAACAASLGKLSADQRRYFQEGNPAARSCLGVSEKHKMVSIYLEPNKTSVEHNLVRLFGSMISIHYGDKLFSDWQAGAQNLSVAFLSDVSEHPEYSVDQWDNLLNSSGGRETFANYVFAEAFDSFYCNKNTRKTFAMDFPATFKVFAAILNEIDKATSAKVKVKSQSFALSGEAETTPAEDLSPDSASVAEEPTSSPSVFSETSASAPQIDPIISASLHTDDSGKSWSLPGANDVLNGVTKQIQDRNDQQARELAAQRPQAELSQSVRDYNARRELAAAEAAEQKRIAAEKYAQESAAFKAQQKIEADQRDRENLAEGAAIEKKLLAEQNRALAIMEEGFKGKDNSIFFENRALLEKQFDQHDFPNAAAAIRARENFKPLDYDSAINILEKTGQAISVTEYGIAGASAGGGAARAFVDGKSKKEIAAPVVQFGKDVVVDAAKSWGIDKAEKTGELVGQLANTGSDMADCVKQPWKCPLLPIKYSMQNQKRLQEEAMKNYDLNADVRDQYFLKEIQKLPQDFYKERRMNPQFLSGASNAGFKSEEQNAMNVQYWRLVKKLRDRDAQAQP